MRERIEDSFAALSRGVIRHRWIAIALCLAVAASLASQLPKLGIETAVETFLMKDDPARVDYDTFREQFGREDLIIIAIESPEIFTLDFLRRLRAFHDELEAEVPHLADIDSLVNARSTYGETDSLIVEDLLEEFPETQEAVLAVRDRVIATPLYLNLLVSEQLDLTTVTLTLELYPDLGDEDALASFADPDEDAPEADGAEAEELEYLSGAQVGAAISAIRAITERYRADDFEIVMAGSPVLQQAIAASMQRDLRRFVVFMVATVAIVLLALFRRLSGVLLPLFVVALTLVSTMGALASSGVMLSPPTQVLPTFILAVGTGATVHILKIFYLRYDAGDAVEDAITEALRHSGLAVAMTSITTAGGLLSFLAGDLRPIVHLGVFAPLGVMLSLVYTLVLLPALVATLPVRRKPSAAGAESATVLERSIVACGDYSVTHPKTMVIVTIVLVCTSLTGAVRLQFTNNVLSWLPDGDPYKHATNVIDQRLEGSITLEVIASRAEPNVVKSPEFLHALDAFQRDVNELTQGDYLFVGKTISITDVAKEIHQALNENRPEFYVVPDDAQLIAQELLLFENTGTDDLEDLVDTQFEQARVTIKVPYVDPMLFRKFITTVEGEFTEAFGSSTNIVTTGFIGMMSKTVERVLHSMAKSYLLALVIITPLMILLIGNLRGGLVSMVPNLTPILITLGLMGFMGITIDMFTMMIGSIAIGLAVDDTIHFIHGFRRDYEALGDPRAAVRETLSTTGRALFVTSVVLSAGFLIFSFSEMLNLYYFGLLTSFTIVMAFVIDIMLTPALLVLVTKPRDA